MFSKLLSILAMGLLSPASCLVINHHIKNGVESFSYQTFSGVAMYAPKDAPAKTAPGNGRSTIQLDLELMRQTSSSEQASVEVVIIPDTNIDDIGIEEDGELHLCCNQRLVNSGACSEDEKGTLILPDVKGAQRSQVHFEDGVYRQRYMETFKVEVTGIHVFAMALCDENAGTVTFEGQSIWMNPYGQLPGDVYGYLPFYGWMCLLYLALSILWFGANAMYWSEVQHVQNCITGVLAILLIEMSTWYFHYLHLNQTGVIHKGPFIVGLLATVSRRMISRMLVVAVALGYGVVKTTLGSDRNKIIVLGAVYWLFAFMFEALIHFSQTEQVSPWLRALLIPPVAIINGIFWWWTFVALNRTIEKLKVRQQTTKLSLYQQFTAVLVIGLIAAIAFAIYEMYYVLKELYFAEWERLWFMEVGFWQLLSFFVFCAILFLWRPSPNSHKYATMSELRSGDYDDEEDEDDDIDGEDTMHDGGGSIDHMETDQKLRYKITDEEDEDPNRDERKPKTTLVSMTGVSTQSA